MLTLLASDDYWLSIRVDSPAVFHRLIRNGLVLSCVCQRLHLIAVSATQLCTSARVRGRTE